MPMLALSSIYNTPIFTLQLTDTAVKEAYGATFHGKSQSWRFPAFYPVHQLVVSDLMKIVPGLQLTEEAADHVACLNTDVTLPPEFSFVTEPYQHQLDGLLHIYRYLRAGLFYSPGLGKCKIVVDLYRLTGDTTLVLCPKVVLNTWAEEFEKHGGIKDTVVIDGYSKKKKLSQIAKAASSAPAAVIVSYGVASLYPEQLSKIDYSCIVADESHRLKSPFSKRTKAATALAGKAYRRILLSGTPSLGSPFDMYGPLRFLGKYFCKEDWWRFRKIFGVFPEWEKHERVPKIVLGYKNIDLMNTRVGLVCVRKTKEECLDLPGQTVIDIKFTMHPQQKKAYNNLITERCDAAGIPIKEALDTGNLNHAAGAQLPPYVLVHEPITLLTKLNQLASGFMYQTTRNPQLCDGCSHVRRCLDNNIFPYTSKCTIAPKEQSVEPYALRKNTRLDECEALLESILEDKQNKVIVWAYYITELDHLEGLAKKLGAQYVRVEGGLSKDQITNRLQEFENNKDCRLYLGQVSTGIGITLNAANYTVYYNLPWSLEHYQQSIDRNYRIGQEKKVTVYRLLAKDTLDTTKAAAIDQKIDFSNLVTKSTVCATCPHFAVRCAKHKTQLYDEECIFERTMMREIAEVRLIP